MTQRIRDLGWVAAPAALSAALVLSLSFIAPATAAPGNGNGQGQERAQAHFAKAKRHDTSKPQEPRRVSQVATSDDTAERSPRSNGGSAVRLDKPNDFQAQADPDGMENGGVDQPGGQGGVDTTSQDGNNGSGNDVDCEDDNRGNGVPGHCKNQGAEVDQPSGVTAEGLDTPVPAPVPAPIPATDGTAPQPEVLGVSVDRSCSPATDDDCASVVPASVPVIAGVSAERDGSVARAAATILPNTGAAAQLGVFGVVGVVLVGLGCLAMRRRGSTTP